MQNHSIYRTQLIYARLAGIMYLLNYATSVFGVLMPPWITGTGDFMQRVQRVVASEHLYRGALVSMAIGWVMIVLLAFALYVTLEPVNKRLAQIALYMELGQASVGAVTVMFSFATLRLYTDAQLLSAFQGSHLQSLVSVSQSIGGSGFQLSMMFLSVGSTIFFYLFYKSRFFPKTLAAWGVFASVVMGMVSMAILVFPEHTRTFLYGWGPMGIAEVGTALWLTIAGIRPRQLAAADTGAA